MRLIKLSVPIAAAREKVWETLTEPGAYVEWTSAFHEGSYYEGGWNKGDSIHFLALDNDGKKGGMASEIAESIYPSYISIRHLGYIVAGVVDTESTEVRKWLPAYENYILTEAEDNSTLFEVEAETIEEYYDMFMEMWPKALQKLKAISERS